MKLRFTKMHGAGNDFVVIDAINQAVNLTSDQWRDIASRRFGIGADQILVVEKPTMPGVDFRYRIFNADGGEVEQCGNGARAFVKFVVEKGLTEHREIRVETMSGVIRPRLEDDGRITVDMGAPIFDTERVPFDPTGISTQQQKAATLWKIPVGSSLREFVVLSMGNPHAVQWVDDVDTAPVLTQGPLIEHHAAFPRRVNVGFMQLLNRSQVRLRVFERGAGETLACGTGACAAVVAGIRLGRLDAEVQVQTHGGVLTIAWDGAGSSTAALSHSVFMSGPATTVFHGEIEIPL